MDFLGNPWVIGIGTGTFSGLISGGLLWRITNGKENRAYQQKVEAVNKEVVHSIRPSVAEEIIPSLDVMEAVIAAAAGRHHLDTKDILGVAEICDILIDEIMVNPFLAAKNKVEFCNELVKRKKEAKKKKKDKGDSNKPPKSGAMLSITLGFVSALLTGVAVILMKLGTNTLDVNRYLFVLASGMIAPITGFYLGILARRFFNRKQESRVTNIVRDGRKTIIYRNRDGKISGMDEHESS